LLNEKSPPHPTILTCSPRLETARVRFNNN
jgi:hypothetical protein